MDTVSPAGSPVTTSPVPTDPYLTAAERERLTPQNGRILAMLRHGPHWNYVLATIGLSYTRRISDLRAAGHQVDIITTGPNGSRLYGLVIACPACNGSGKHWSGGSCYDCGNRGIRLVSRNANASVPGCDLSPIAWSDVSSYAQPENGCLAAGRAD